MSELLPHFLITKCNIKDKWNNATTKTKTNITFGILVLFACAIYLLTVAGFGAVILNVFISTLFIVFIGYIIFIIWQLIYLCYDDTKWYGD